MDAAYRQAIHEAAQRVTKYFFHPPKTIPVKVQIDILILAFFGWAKCTRCQHRPVSELGSLCPLCSPESTVTECNNRTCNHRMYHPRPFHCCALTCMNYAEKCDAH